MQERVILHKNTDKVRRKLFNVALKLSLVDLKYNLD